MATAEECKVDEAENAQPALRRRASLSLARLEPQVREALLVKCWMSHDAYWYGAIGAAHGTEAVNRANQLAARRIGRTEAFRAARIVGIAPIATVDDALEAQETMIALVGADLLDYRIEQVSSDGYRFVIDRCFAHRNITRAGFATDYLCGIFTRIQGWFEAFGAEVTITPAVGRCLKVTEGSCVHTFAFNARG